jgi:hypothetical protein
MYIRTKFHTQVNKEGKRASGEIFSVYKPSNFSSAVGGSHLQKEPIFIPKMSGEMGKGCVKSNLPLKTVYNLPKLFFAARRMASEAAIFLLLLASAVCGDFGSNETSPTNARLQFRPIGGARARTNFTSQVSLPTDCVISIEILELLGFLWSCNRAAEMKSSRVQMYIHM